MDKVPDWLQAVTVEFVCNNCPNRKTKNIAFISLEPTTLPAMASDSGSGDEPEEEEAEEPAED
jgi:hypothetical protein